MELSARVVINATGVWAAEVDPAIKLRPSRGTHLVFDAAVFGNPTAALTVPIPGRPTGSYSPCPSSWAASIWV